MQKRISIVVEPTDITLALKESDLTKTNFGLTNRLNSSTTSLTKLSHQMLSGNLPSYWIDFKWHTFMFMMLFCSNSAHFSEIRFAYDGRMDGLMDGPPMAGRTDWRSHYLIEVRECILKRGGFWTNHSKERTFFPGTLKSTINCTSGIDLTQITRPDTRHKMHLLCVLFTFENNAGHTDLRTDGGTDGRTDTTSYRDA